MYSDSTLVHIHTKMNEINSALVRFQDNDIQVSLHVKVKCEGKNSIDCRAGEIVDLDKMHNKKLTLIQKSDKDYLYISGELVKKSRGAKNEFSLRMLRACWFILKSKGSVSWLQNKYIYDISAGPQLELAS